MRHPPSREAPQRRLALTARGWLEAGTGMQSPLTRVPGGTVTTGDIEGQVLDLVSGEPLPATLAEVTSRPSEGAKSTITESDGRYSFRNLPPGRYSLVHRYGDEHVPIAADVVAGHVTQVSVVIDTSEAEVLMIDGAEWIIEGLRGRDYHVAVRNSPTDEVYRDGERFRQVALWLLRQANLGIPEKETY